jgi:FAD/FMN-containing dehydrogenase
MTDLIARNLGILDELDGRAMTRDSAGYDLARRVWNGMIDSTPALIVRCASERDVVTTVRLAGQTGLPLAVRGGGHALPGFGTVDDGIVLDLDGLREVRVDRERRVGFAGGGARWADVDAATSLHGLATTGGLISSTGVGGLTLGGGIGWLTRYCGLACDNLLSATIVTADGCVRQVDSGTDPELLWALRGGGGNFGVVTSFEFRLRPVGQVTGGMMLFPLARIGQVGSAYREWADGLNDAFTTMLVCLTAPDIEDLPTEVAGRPAVAVVGCHVGGEDAAEHDLAPLRALNPVADMFEPMTYPHVQQMFDADMPPGRRYYFTGVFTDGCADGVLEVLADAIATCPSAGCEIDLHHMGGAAGRVPPDATAFSGRAAAFTANILAGWEEPFDDDAHRDWVRRTAAALRPFGGGGDYVNFMGDARESGDVENAYGGARYLRLREVKRRVDPDNIFRLNQNIRP